MIYVRDDDVIGKSSSWDDSLGRFKQVHNWILEHDNFLHRPYIVVMDTQQTPEAIDYIKEQTDRGKMDPQIHGLWHIDYAKLTEEQVKSHLSVCLEWFEKIKLPTPTRWATPWGANSPLLQKVSAELRLALIDTKDINKLQGRHGVVQRLRDGESINFLEEKEIFMHYWEGGARLKRVIEVAKHGSWEAAAKANKELFE